MRAIEVDWACLHYALDGPEGAPSLALVNSLGTDFRLWDAFLAHLQGSWRVLRYDFRGHGLSSLPSEPVTIERHAADLDAMLRALDLGPAVVFGVSVGGQIAQALAARAPERVRALILAATAAKIGDEASWAARIDQVRDVGLLGMADGVLERWFPQAWRCAHPFELSAWRMMLARQSADGYVATCMALRDADLRASSARLAVPTLVIAGSEDLATPPDVVRGLHALIPGAEWVEIEGTGHLAMVDAADELASAVNPFLARLAP